MLYFIMENYRVLLLIGNKSVYYSREGKIVVVVCLFFLLFFLYFFGMLYLVSVSLVSVSLIIIFFILFYLFFISSFRTVPNFQSR